MKKVKKVKSEEDIRNALTLYNKALELQMAGDEESSKEFYIKSLQILETPQAHNNLGNILKKEGRFEEARKHYISALKLDKDYAPALLNLGILYLEIDQFERAYWTLKILLKMKIQTNWKRNAILAYGLACLETERLDEAYKIFKRMISENEIPAYFGILEVLRKMGKYDELLHMIDDLKKKGLKIQELDLLEKVIRKKLNG